jgi:aminoglycoside phosphotransferase (APT) family kinase protein
MDWLTPNMPDDDGASAIVHGDYRIDNMIYAKDSPQILALLNWELSTLDHPLADLAYQCMHWYLPNAAEFKGLAGMDRAAIGLPTEEECVAKYCDRRGTRVLDNLNFYLVFSYFRFLAIVQGVLKRALDGNASNPKNNDMIAGYVALIARDARKLT